MPPKKSRNNPPKPTEPEIIVQNPPQSPERKHTSPEASSIRGKNPTDVVVDEPDTPLTRAENHLYRVLIELEASFDEACKTNAAIITMNRNLFESIATNTQKAWEEVKEAKCAYEEGLILKSLKYIQTSIAGLEEKYEDIVAIRGVKKQPAK